MDQKWIHILVILVFYQKIPSGAGVEQTVKEGAQVDITCKPDERGSLIVWFRVLANFHMEFIGSYNPAGMQKKTSDLLPLQFIDSKVVHNILILKSFNRTRDSGIYNCASLIRGVELKFGKETRLVGEPVVAPAAPTTSIKQKTQCTTAAPCVCNTSNKQGEPSPAMFCTPIILGPLVGGCGLLLLLLLITTMYCHKIRTRRCPHHYKRQPRPMPAGKQMNNRPV